MCHKIAGFNHVLSVSVAPSVSVESAKDAGQKCPQFCGIGWMLNKLYFDLVPQEKVQGREVWRTRWLKIDCRVYSHGPTDERHTWHFERRGRPMWRGAMSPSERSLRSQCFVVASGTPSAAAVYLAPKPRFAMRSTAKRSSADRTMLWEGLKTLVIWGTCGLWCVDMLSSRSCASVCNVKKLLFFVIFFKKKKQRAFLIRRGSKIVVFHPNFDPTSLSLSPSPPFLPPPSPLFYDNLWKNENRMPGTQGKKGGGVEISGGLRPGGHPVFRVPEVCSAAIVDCCSIHGTLWVFQETFFESLPARAGRSSVLLENSLNLASSSCGLGSSDTGDIMEHWKRVWRDP